MAVVVRSLSPRLEQRELLRQEVQPVQWVAAMSMPVAKLAAIGQPVAFVRRAPAVACLLACE